MGVLCALMAFGLLLSLLNAPLASSAANSVEIIHIAEAVPTDPQSEAWERAVESEIPLSAQQIYQPGGGSTRAVRVRALDDGQTVAIRVSWDDDTRNDSLGTTPSDSAAIQLPLDPTHLPYQCMGQSTSRVNIWQWKAALEQTDNETFGAMGTTDMQGAGIRNLTSNGICKAVDTPGVEPKASSFHDGKAWHVVFYRSLAGAEAGTAPIVRGGSTSIAFAVWNGARGEARGMKAVSTWNALQSAPLETSATSGLLTLGAVVALSAGAVAIAMRRLAS